MLKYITQRTARGVACVKACITLSTYVTRGLVAFGLDVERVFSRGPLHNIHMFGVGSARARGENLAWGFFPCDVLLRLRERPHKTRQRASGPTGPETDHRAQRGRVGSVCQKVDVCIT